MRTVLALLALAHVARAATAGELAREVRETALEAEECYRVRDLTLVRGDVRYYLTDGFLVFGKPLAGRRIAAVFSADTEGGDAEVLMLPPHPGERRSLASYTGSPNLNEHFTQAVFIFSDDTGRLLWEQVRKTPDLRPAPERGLLLAEKWNPVVRNIAASFETRLALDLLSGSVRGFHAAVLTGRRLGNFDILYDPSADEAVVVGQVTVRDNRPYFDIWTSFTPRGHTAERQEFALEDYRIEATLEPDLRLRAVTRVRLKPVRALPVLPLFISRRMEVMEAKVDGQPAEVFQRESLRANLRNAGNELFLLAPPRPLGAGRAYELELRHEGRVVFDAGNQVYFVGERSHWYPNRPRLFATFDMTFRYPKDLRLVSAGEVVEDREEGEQRVTRRRVDTPIRLAGFNLGRYEQVRVARGGYTVEVYANPRVERALQPRTEPLVVLPPPFHRGPPRRPEILALPAPPPPSPAAGLRELAGDIAGALEFMAARFGPPALPLLTVSPVPGRFGQGFPGLIYLSTLAYLAPSDRPVAALDARQRLFFTEILEAHETAHQWWGNVVTSATYRDDWLMEALANYSALLYLEKRKGARSLEAVLDEYKAQLLEKTESGQTVEAAGPIVLGTRLESSQTPNAWRHITYGKGSWILHMLRAQMGEKRFLELLAELPKRYPQRAIDTEEFRLLSARFLPAKWADPKLEAFFDQWVYSTGIPELKLSHAVKGKAPNLRLTGSVEQGGGAAHARAATLVPVEIQFRGRKPLVQWVQAGEPFTIALRQAPARVALDPANQVLRR